jgi:hypothetical protein
MKKILLVILLIVMGCDGRGYMEGFREGKEISEKIIAAWADTTYNIVYYPNEKIETCVFDTITGDVYGLHVGDSVSNVMIIGFGMDFTGVEKDTVERLTYLSANNINLADGNLWVDKVSRYSHCRFQYLCFRIVFITQWKRALGLEKKELNWELVV